MVFNPLFLQNGNSNGISNTPKFIKLNNDLVDYTLRGSSDLWKKLKSTVGDLKLYTPKQGETLSSLLNKNRLADVRRLKEAINRVFLTGETYNNVKKEFKKTFSKPYNLSFTG